MEALEWIGFVVMLLGGIGILIAAFSTGIWWGLGCLFLWPVSLLFLFLHWDVARNPFLLHVAGLALWFVGSSA